MNKKFNNQCTTICNNSSSGFYGNSNVGETINTIKTFEATDVELSNYLKNNFQSERNSGALNNAQNFNITD